jgi:hypothetical protein
VATTSSMCIRHCCGYDQGAAFSSGNISAHSHQNPKLSSSNNFVYSPSWKKGIYRSDLVATGVDSAGHERIPCDNCYGVNALQAGHDYIVLLRTVPLDYDGSVSYYNYYPVSSYSPEGGFFEIDGLNNVVIPSKFFGYGTQVPLATFMSAIRTDISNITSH